MNTPPAIRIAIWTWFIAALLAGRLGVWQRMSPIAVLGVLVVLTAVLLLAYRTVVIVRTWVDGTGLRTLVLLHVTRFVSFYFLVLHHRGEMPHAVAVPGGIGGIVVAASAAVIALAPLPEPIRQRAISIWNVVGTIELLMLILSATLVGQAAPGALFAFTFLPLSVLPTFLFPLMFASHLAIFSRIARPER